MDRCSGEHLQNIARVLFISRNSELVTETEKDRLQKSFFYVSLSEGVWPEEIWEELVELVGIAG